MPSKASHVTQPACRVVHRAAVFDSAGDITHIVSQSDVIRFLRSRMPDMSEWASCKLRCVVFPYEEVPL